MNKLLPVALIALLSLASSNFARAQGADEEEPINVRATSLKIQSLLQKKDFEGADKAFEAALKANPDMPQIAGLRRMLAQANSRANRHTEAIAHASAYVDFQLGVAAKKPSEDSGLTPAVESLLYVARKAEQPEAGEKKLDEALAAVAAQQEKEPQDALVNTLAQLKGAKISHLVEIKQTKKARAILKPELANARKAYALDKSNVGATLALASFMNSQVEYLEAASPDKAADAARKYRKFVATVAKERPGEAEIVGLYLNAKTTEFYEVVQADPTAGEKVQAELKAYLAHLEAANPEAKGIATRGTQLVTSMTRQIATSRAHADMTGKPATELDVETWVNGPSLRDEDLVGKVVLLDFWAVWCGPCIATFPHLRDWQEKYSDKGLVIIGLTRYYQYDWDEKTASIERVQGLEPEKEQAAMVKFAEHHKLKHRFGVMPADSVFSKTYDVLGIPQVVLIDRAGKVRMIRVGSGKQNAHDLEEAIQQALAAPAP